MMVETKAGVKLGREIFLQTLGMVEPGLSARGLLEQSDCFVFLGGLVYAFDDNVCVSAPSGLSEDAEGACPGTKLKEIVDKLKEDEVELTMEESRLVIRGRRKEAWVRREAKIELPVKDVLRPDVWSPLHEDFGEAVGRVRACAGRDETDFPLPCVHMHPKWVEASDNFQIWRWTLDTGLTRPTLARAAGVRHIASLGVHEYGETDGWVHFRNPHGVVMSCRRFADEYADTSPYLEVRGKPVVLPKQLAEAAERAAVFSSENDSSDLIKVEVKRNLVRVTGEGASGGYRQRLKVEYSGPDLTFFISPSVLVDVVKKTNECTLAEGRLWVTGPNFVYLALLDPDAGQEGGGDEEDGDE